MFAAGLAVMLTVGSALAEDEEGSGGVSSAGGTVGGVVTQGEGEAQPLPKVRFTYESLLAARTNPLGLSIDLRPALRLRLYESTSVIGRDNYIDIAPTFNVSPALMRGGVSMRLQPAAVLRIGGRVERISYFGGFDQIQSWDDAESAVWDDYTQDTRGEAGENYGTTGWFAAGEVLLRAKVSSIAVINQSRLLYTDMELQGGDTVMYDITYDALLANQSMFQINDASVVWVPESMPLTAGARWSYVRAFHPNEPDSVAAEPLHRLGPLVAWTFRTDEGAGVGNLSAFSLVQWWLKHPYRTGQVINQAVPYVVLGLSVRGDLRPF